MPSTHCTHCGVRAPDHLLFGGFCTECAGEQLALPSEDRDFLERFAVEHCRAAGLNVLPRPCPEPVYVEIVESDGTRTAVARACPACEGSNDHAAIPRRRPHYVRPRYDAAFSERDGADLEAYFRCPEPVPVWDRSNFGAMCERLAANSRPHSTDRSSRAHELRAEWRRCTERVEPRCGYCRKPTIEHIKYFASQHKPAHRAPDFPQIRLFYDIEVGGRLVQVQVMSRTVDPDAGACELMVPHPAHAEASYDETDVWSFVDGRHAMRDAGMALSLCERWVQAVLEARYARSPERGLASTGRGPRELSRVHKAMRDKLGMLDEVAPMTNRARELSAIQGLGPAQLVAELVTTIVDETRKHEDKREANARLDAIRSEARALLDAAQAAYASASLEVRNGTPDAPELAAQ